MTGSSSVLDPDVEASLIELLEESRALGFLGPGPVHAHIEHALDLAQLLHSSNPARALDLGSGGGVPGLVLLAALPHLQLVLLDAQRRRTEFLERAVAHLGYQDRADVVTARAEVAGRQTELRHGFDLVVARSFGPPATTAECGAPFLTQGGRLIVSEPPPGPERWPADGLADLGLVLAELHGGPDARFHYVVLEARSHCGDRFPRRDGVPAKRPLFFVAEA